MQKQGHHIWERLYEVNVLWCEGHDRLSVCRVGTL